MSVEYRVISIGTLSHNRLWGEGASVRTAHATSTLVEADDRRILVDPSLPATALNARFNERTGKTLADVTDVFCTTLRPVHRRALDALGHARLWASEAEIEAYGRFLRSLQESAERLDAENVEMVGREMEIVEKFQPAPDKFTEQVHLFPLPGPSEGGAGLLLTPATLTIVIAGDAALSREHIERGQVWEGSADSETAMESLQDILEIADVIIPGHDNVTLSPSRYM